MDFVWVNEFSGAKIWLFQDSSIKVTSVMDSSQASTFLVQESAATSFYFTVAYASVDRIIRRDLWLELINFSIGISLPWLVGGDFNVVCYSSEVVSVAEFDQPPADEFIDFQNFAGLLE